jgi:hypothetical protein
VGSADGSTTAYFFTAMHGVKTTSAYETQYHIELNIPPTNLLEITKSKTIPITAKTKPYPRACPHLVGTRFLAQKYAARRVTSKITKLITVPDCTP